MNRNKKNKNVKVNKAINNMGDSNSISSLTTEGNNPNIKTGHKNKYR